MKNIHTLMAVACIGTGPSLANAEAPHAGEAVLAKIEARWGGVMTKIRGWNADSLRQFREGYRDYPADVLEAALAARSFERMMDTLDAHAAVRSQQVMEKALSKAHSMAETLPEDAANAQLVEARQLVSKALGDDARDLVFIPVTPCTVWDTRFATNPDSAGAIGSSQTKRFYSHLDGAGGSYAAYGGNPSCPETAQNFIGVRPFAVMMTVFINNAASEGWITFYRDGDADPSLATISVYASPGPTRTQAVISKSSRGYGTGTYDVAATSRFASTHAAASVTGYFVKVNEVGTVSSVGTGPGLTGGPITASGTINLAATNLMPTVACAPTQIPRWSGSAWSCSADIDTNSGGTVTSVGATAPLQSSGGNTPSISFASTTIGTLLAGTGGAPAFTNSPYLAGSLSVDGNINLPDSTATVGNVIKPSGPFLHSYGFNNVFVGQSAGNLSMTGFWNAGTGHEALTSNTGGTGNVANGFEALRNNTGGNFNAALGKSALSANTTGSANIAVGAQTLLNNTTGTYNIAIGQATMMNNTTADDNTAIGQSALFSNTVGTQNAAIGTASLVTNTSGNTNTAAGPLALFSNTTGSDNIGIGHFGGGNLTTGNSNIAIGNAGVTAESNTVRIGTLGAHTRAFFAGIRGITTGSGDTVPVLVDINGQLGTISSSRGVKDGIADMDAASSALMKLRPVTFHYKGDSSHRLQYGLIAEEVAEVYPGLIARTAGGEVETVMYQFLPSMLLNEYQKLAVEVTELRRQMADMARLLEQRRRDESIHKTGGQGS